MTESIVGEGQAETLNIEVIEEVMVTLKITGLMNEVARNGSEELELEVAVEVGVMPVVEVLEADSNKKVVTEIEDHSMMNLKSPRQEV